MDAPRVKANEVEPGPHLVREQGGAHVQNEKDARPPRPARIQKDGSQARLGICCGQANQFYGDCLAVGIVVVQGDVQGSAVEAGTVRGRTILPLNLRRRGERGRDR